MSRLGSDPDVPAFAAGEKTGGVDEVMPDDEAAAANFDYLGNQGELVIQGHRPQVIAMRVDDRCRPSLPQQRR
jgi:hypothetical protein